MFDELSNIDFEDDLLKSSFCNSKPIQRQEKSNKLPLVTNIPVYNEIKAPREDDVENNERKGCKRKSSESTVFQSNQDFSDDPWLLMENEILRNSSKTLELYTIDWIKSQVRQNRLPERKAPFLVAIINHIEVFSGKIPIINVKLIDKTGEMNATILHSLFDEYAENLIKGSVIVLKDFGVLKTGMHDNYCAAINMNNLLLIYSKDKQSKTKKIEVQKFDLSQLIVRPLSDTFIQLANRRLVTEATSNSPKIISNNKKIQKIKNTINCKNVSNGNSLQSNHKTNSTSLPYLGKINNNKRFLVETKNIFSDAEELNLSLNEEKSNSVVESKEITCSQVTLEVNSSEQANIWKNALEDIDVNDLFDDF